MKTMEALSPPGGHTGVFPLSNNQVVSWYQPVLSPDAPVYLWHLPLGIRISGALDVEALHRCIGAIVQRHASLRTTFEQTWLKQPRQRVHKQAPVALEVVDLRDLAAEARETTLRRRLQALLKQPFDWKHAPPWRIALFRLEEREYLFFVAVHHIVADAWSQAVLFRELSALYEAFRKGEPPQLAPPEAQYSEYVAWEKARRKGGGIDDKFRYWAEQLTPPPRFLEGLTDHPRPAAPSCRGARIPFQVPPDVRNALRDLGRREQSTLFMTLLSGLSVLAHAQTGLEDFCLGTFVANRNRAEVRNLVGCFIECMPIRMDLRGDPAFCELLGRVREATLAAQAHMELPFVKIREVAPPELPAPQPPLQVVLILHSELGTLPGRRLEAAEGLELEVEEIGNHGAKRDWTFHVFDGPEGLNGYLEYDTDLFEAGTIARTLEQYGRLLADLAARPERPLSEFAASLEAGLSQG